MADFHEVHRDLIEKQMAKFAPRKGDYFCIALLKPHAFKGAEPAPPLFDPPRCERVQTAIFIRLDAEGHFRPAGEVDRAAVDAWSKTYARHNAAAFRIPDPWGDGRFGPDE